MAENTFITLSNLETFKEQLDLNLEKKVDIKYVEEFFCEGNSDTITWDGNFAGKTNVDLIFNILGTGKLTAVKISDNVINQEDCINGINLEITVHGDPTEAPVEQLFIDAETTQSSFRADGLAYFQPASFAYPLLLVVPTDNYSLHIGAGADYVLEKGIYLAYIMLTETRYVYCSRVNIPGYTGFRSITLDPKHIPTIDESMLTEDVQTSLNKADTALQSFTETDPTVPSHVKSITTSDIANWNNKSDFSGDYNDLINKPPALKNPYSLKFGSKTYDGSSEKEITAGDLGLTGAMNFLGTSTTAISDGSTTKTITVDSKSVTAKSGNVVLYGGFEYVWDGSKWEQLGQEGSFKVKQSPVPSPDPNGNTISFIDTITQDANGVISPTKKTINAGNGIAISNNAIVAKAGSGITVDSTGINHTDTSSQASITANGRKYITGVTLDTYGHVTGLTTGTETVQDTNSAHTHSVGTGLKKTGNGGTSGDVKYEANLKSTSSLGTLGSTSKLYAVGVDSNGNLAVNVPWTDTNTNTWQKNTVSQDGYVTAPTSGNANKVWKTDGSGKPDWRNDSNTTYTLSKSGSTITLTGSDGLTSSVTDSTGDNDKIYSESGANLSASGWYRVAKFSASSVDAAAGSGAGSCEIIINTGYNYYSPSTHHVQLLSRYYHSKFQTIYDYAQGNLISKIRHILDTNAKVGYIDIYYNHNQSNSVNIQIFNGVSAYDTLYWEAITPYAVAETGTGWNNLAEHNLGIDNTLISRTSNGLIKGKIEIDTGSSSKSSPGDQELIVSRYGLSASQLNVKTAPGIGFHIANVDWANLLFDGSFKFMNSNFGSYLPVYASTFNGNLNGTAATAISAHTLDGFTRSGTGTWGNQTGTCFMELAANSNTGGGGCGLQFRKDNPGSGQLSMLIDGTVYVNEGTDKVATESKVQEMLDNFANTNIFTKSY